SSLACCHTSSRSWWLPGRWVGPWRQPPSGGPTARPDAETGREGGDGLIARASDHAGPPHSQFWVVSQVLEQRLPIRWQRPLHNQLLELGLDPPYLRSGCQAPYAHDVAPAERDSHAARSLLQDAAQPALQLAQLAAVGIPRRRYVCMRQLHQRPELVAGVAREPPHGAIGPVGRVEDGPQVEHDQPRDTFHLAVREAKPVERLAGQGGAHGGMPSERAVWSHRAR